MDRQRSHLQRRAAQVVHKVVIRERRQILAADGVLRKLLYQLVQVQRPQVILHIWLGGQAAGFSNEFKGEHATPCLKPKRHLQVSKSPQAAA